MNKVFIVHGTQAYVELFQHLGFEVIHDLAKADLACFTGGADVSPGFYGAAVHPTTYSDPARDAREKIIFDYCQRHEIPTVGICRGGQFLNVMSGGEMYQNCTNHTTSHMIEDTRTGDMTWVSSTHHQMMKPSEKGEIVALSVDVQSRTTYFDKTLQQFVNEDTENGIEVVYYAHTNALCFQPHPEFQSYNYFSMKQYFAELLDEFFGFECKTTTELLLDAPL